MTLPRPRSRRAWLAAMLVALGLATGLEAAAHDFKLGPLRIDHPYATPTPAGARTGAAYLRTLRNTKARLRFVAGIAGRPSLGASWGGSTIAGASNQIHRDRHRLANGAGCSKAMTAERRSGV